jgi:hypothetical protein
LEISVVDRRACSMYERERLFCRPIPAKRRNRIVDLCFYREYDNKIARILLNPASDCVFTIEMNTGQGKKGIMERPEPSPLLV